MIPALIKDLIDLGNGIVSGRVLLHPHIENGTSVSFEKSSIVWDRDDGLADDPHIWIKGVRVYLS